MTFIIPQTALLVASLHVVFATNGVQKETIARNVLVFFQLKNIARLDAALLNLREVLAALGGDVLVDKPGVHFNTGFAEFLIGQVVDCA